MKTCRAIASRDFRAFFLFPSGYVVIALFLLGNSIVFMADVFVQGQPASMRSIFDFDVVLLLFLCPAVTMRSVCEERRLGTLELISASPASAASFVVGKFLSSLASLVVILLPTLFLVVLLELYGQPDYGEIASGYLGLLLVGSMYLGSGILASVISGSQTIAYLLSVFFFILLSLGREALPAWTGPDAWSLMKPFDPFLRMQDFTIGLIDSSSVLFFLLVTSWFLLASIAVLESERRS